MLVDITSVNSMFSFRDGFAGYNQIRMDPLDVEKAAFRTPINDFHYIVMPVGLKNCWFTYK